MTSHELARILARGPDLPVVLQLPRIRIELTAAYYVGEVRYLPAEDLLAVGHVIAIGAPDDPAIYSLTGESAGHRSTVDPTRDRPA